MKHSKKPSIPFVSLLGTYASYLIPLVLGDRLSNREVLIVTFFSSLVFLTIFIAIIYSTLNEYLYKIKCLQNDLETSEIKIDILKGGESQNLELLLQESKQVDV